MNAKIFALDLPICPTLLHTHLIRGKMSAQVHHILLSIKLWGWYDIYKEKFM